jgi:hypothetical protein
VTHAVDASIFSQIDYGMPRTRVSFLCLALDFWFRSKLCRASSSIWLSGAEYASASNERSVQKKAGGYTERSAEYLMQSVEKK